MGLSGADHFYRARVVRMVFMHVHGECLLAIRERSDAGPYFTWH